MERNFFVMNLGNIKAFLKDLPIGKMSGQRQATRKATIERRQRKEIAYLEKRSLIEPLTGFYNKRWLLGDESDELGNSGELYMEFERIKRELLQKKKHTGALTVFVIDIDHFKEINDDPEKGGHLVADQVLRNLAVIFKKNLRSFDKIARFGGDEFVVLLWNTKQEEAELVLDRIRIRAKKKKISFSYGIADNLA